MLMFTLAISCLTTSNLPWFMDLWFQIPMKYCLQHCSLLHHQSYPQLGVFLVFCLFLLWFHLFILSDVISPFFSSSILGTYQPGELIFQCYLFIYLPFHTVCGVLKARILKWFAIPFSRGPCFVRTHHHQSQVSSCTVTRVGDENVLPPVDSPWNYMLPTRVHQSFSAKLPRWLRW